MESTGIIKTRAMKTTGEGFGSDGSKKLRQLGLH